MLYFGDKLLEQSPSSGDPSLGIFKIPQPFECLVVDADDKVFREISVCSGRYNLQGKYENLANFRTRALGCVHPIRSPAVLTPEGDQGKLSFPCHLIRQKVKWYFVLDFESTCDNKSTVKAEIIEFPVVLVEAETGTIVDEFHSYVRPTENQTLSKFCTSLTGISQETVDNAEELKTVLKDFEFWLRSKKRALNCTFKLGSPNAAVFVTWTDWDIRTCLWNECQRKRLPLPLELLNRIDLKAVFKHWLANTSRSPQADWHGNFSDALKAAGLTFKGRPHSGIDDARNTALLLLKMLSSRGTEHAKSPSHAYS
ncbi:unnamed protein product [Dibothriocephalus latus]|uniref:Exonuclease domain-containing protein n=1 Tax=Dibothriocephalus latus TaxID=60516 RepID=A0A3P6TF67_DIBLA|nr:unnamed protein product [Dibothriocephalus latus]